MIKMLALNIPPELEEDLIDYLLSLEAVTGFTSYETRGHGSDVTLSIAEQVSGRRKRLQFERLIEEREIQSLLDGLSTEVGKDIVYWEQAIEKLGHIV
ncbi:MAG: DUF3240 family protein [Gammaproteobacteria bacterium]|nr:DUF3240 family protein [Gammaproteobacteria bacterium]MBL4890358.1 DUF3240 family protein [Rhizobiaceae bacterium]